MLNKLCWASFANRTKNKKITFLLIKHSQITKQNKTHQTKEDIEKMKSKKNFLQKMLLYQTVNFAGPIQSCLKKLIVDFIWLNVFKIFCLLTLSYKKVLLQSVCLSPLSLKTKIKSRQKKSFYQKFLNISQLFKIYFKLLINLQLFLIFL